MIKIKQLAEQVGLAKNTYVMNGGSSLLFISPLFCRCILSQVLIYIWIQFLHGLLMCDVGSSYFKKAGNATVLVSQYNFLILA